MEVSRARQQLAEHLRAVDELPRDEVHDLVLPLPLPMYFEEARVDERAALLVAHPLPNNDIHLPGLVLEREESDTAGSLRPLPHQDDTCGTDRLAVGHTLELVSTEKLLFTQSLAQQRQRMTSERQPDGRVIRDDALAFGRRRQQWLPLD